MSDGFDPDAYLQSSDSGEPAFDPDTHLEHAVPTIAPPVPLVAPIKYDADLFRQRVGRAPTPFELSQFAANKGEGWPGFTIEDARQKNPEAGRFTPGQAAVGAGEDVLSLVTGIPASIPAAVTYAASPYSRNLENARAVQSALTYKPRTEAGQAGLAEMGNVASQPGKLVTGLADIAEPSGQLSAALSDIGERTGIAAPLLGEGVAAVRGGGVTRAVANKVGASDFGAGAAEPSTAAPGTPHPLQAVADQESSRISQAIERGRARGIELPQRSVSPNQEGANGIVRDELNLAPGSPITPKVLDAARQEHGAPAYEAVSNVPKVKLGDAYEDDIGKVDLSSIKEQYRPPPGGSITGQRAVELSKYLREKASDYFQEGTVEGNEKGQAHWDAAQAVEDAVERRLKATGQGELATNWDNARTYYAKTYSVQGTLDGAGNVVAPKLRTQLIKGKPLSGGLQDLATMAATNPEAFKSMPMAPKPSLLRRGISAVIPPLATAGGALAGGAVGFPTTGAVLGEGAGVRIADRVRNP